jgi:hypothetical protein
MLLVRLLASAPTRLQRLLVILVACLLAKRRPLAAACLRPIDLLAPGQWLLLSMGTLLLILVRLLMIPVRRLLIQASLLLSRGRFSLFLQPRQRH